MRHPAPRTVGPYNDEMLQLLAESDVGDVMYGAVIWCSRASRSPTRAPRRCTAG
ncbi:MULTISPECIES: hypothetical protein [unclassified Streptomyces]|uniref:hypothetical protein n=1 Tax=unclassified Streptomyces TaxID=2593676 RepID=UPI002DD9D2B8|nr:hypothetical protein [Streptomyces sp. NBC_01750]WSB01184.1 hypothetical protein OIE54_18810 [Streptomyces sp. NBC_01794]WSD34461.1 hypothetical protein OG966_22795 [Streptomyces sp. NBC_01750]